MVQQPTPLPMWPQSSVMQGAKGKVLLVPLDTYMTVTVLLMRELQHWPVVTMAAVHRVMPVVVQGRITPAVAVVPTPVAVAAAPRAGLVERRYITAVMAANRFFPAPIWAAVAAQAKPTTTPLPTAVLAAVLC